MMCIDLWIPTIFAISGSLYSTVGNKILTALRASAGFTDYIHSETLSKKLITITNLIEVIYVSDSFQSRFKGIMKDPLAWGPKDLHCYLGNESIANRSRIKRARIIS